MNKHIARLKAYYIYIDRQMIRFQLWRQVQQLIINFTLPRLHFRSIYSSFQKHLSISLMAVMFVGGSVMTSNRETGASLASIFPVAPDELVTIVDEVKIYTPTIDENAHNVAQSVSEHNNSYFQQLSILSLGVDNESNQFSEIGEIYVVQDGDSYAKIAANVGLRTGSLLVANNIDAKKIKTDPKALMLKKDQKIIIPYENLDDGDDLFQIAVDAAASRKEALTQIANNKKGSKNIATNNKGKIIKSKSGTKRDYNSYFGFTAGWCTAYIGLANARVASAIRSVGGGNASAWPSQARSAGLKVDKNPENGSVIYTKESRYGHVSVQKQDLGNSIIIGEYNGPAGRGVYGEREIPKSMIAAVIH